MLRSRRLRTWVHTAYSVFLRKAVHAGTIPEPEIWKITRAFQEKHLTLQEYRTLRDHHRRPAPYREHPELWAKAKAWVAEFGDCYHCRREMHAALVDAPFPNLKVGEQILRQYWKGTREFWWKTYVPLRRGWRICTDAEFRERRDRAPGPKKPWSYECPRHAQMLRDFVQHPMRDQ